MGPLLWLVMSAFHFSKSNIEIWSLFLFYFILQGRANKNMEAKIRWHDFLCFFKVFVPPDPRRSSVFARVIHG